MHARGLLLAALLVSACASGAQGQGNTTLSSTVPTSAPASTPGTAMDEPSTATATATPATATDEPSTATTVSGTSVLPTSVPATSVPAIAVLATSITGPAVTRPTATPATDAVDTTPDERPVDLYVPTSYDGSNAMPLIVLLHGYTVSSELQEAYFNLEPLAEARGFLYVRPQGTTDQRGSSFWNATDGCCNFFGSSVDDSAYLASLIAQVQASYNVDARRIYLIGHSNGGFMSYRMACDHADTVAAIVSLAGATFDDATGCVPSHPVSVLQIHGTEDGVIRYDGGRFVGAYPSALTTVRTWASYDGCSSTPVQFDERRDLERDIEGDDTTVSHFSECPSGIDVELWTIDGGSHIPALSSTFAEQVLDFLSAHPKP